MAKVIAVVTQVNGNGTAVLADVTYSLDTIAFTTSLQVSLSGLTSQADVIEIVKNAVLTDVNSKGIGTYTYSDIIIATTGATESFGRDVIVSSKVVSGNADFFSVSSLNLTLLADSTNPFIYNIGGTQFKLTADVTLGVTDDANNFVWVNNLGAMGRSAVPPKYDYEPPGAPSANDYWYDLGKSVMKQYDGAAWQVVSRIFIGYVRADSAAINARYYCNQIGITPHQRFAMFGDGSDGFLDKSSATETIDGTKNYTFVVTRGTGVITHTADGNTLLCIKSQGGIACIGTAGINLTGKGNDNGNGTLTTGAAGVGNSYGGGGGGGGGGTSAGGAGGVPMRLTRINATTSAAGGGGGGVGGAGVAGRVASVTAADGFLSPLFLYGNGGGGGGGDGALAGGNGGEGGGACSIITDAVAIGASATINANGTAGVVGGGANRGGGGGGGGGVINMAARGLFGGTNFTCTGGAGGGSGGAGSGAGAAGATGAAARVKI